MPAARLVKAFNSVGNSFMVNPSFADGRPTMFICGNDDAAKQEVTRLCEQLGTASLTDMLRDATTLAEQHFIRMALERAAGDPVAAASLLGVDAQALQSLDLKKNVSP